MTDADLDKLEALARVATPGEWRAWITRRRQPEIYTDGGSSEQNDKIASGVLRKADAAFIAAANPATILDLIASARRDAEEIERLRAKLDRYEGARVSDVSDEEAGRMIKAFWATVEQWSGEEWNDEKAQRLGLMNMGLMQAMAMAAQSNAETFTYTANGVTHKGEPIGDWTVTVARAAHTGEG